MCVCSLWLPMPLAGPGCLQVVDPTWEQQAAVVLSLPQDECERQLQQVSRTSPFLFPVIA